MTVQTTKLTPSLLARKILCTAYMPAPFGQGERLVFLGLHAMTVVKVIARHLRMGYRLRSVERGGKGYRIDLLFDGDSGRTRIVEVKSSKQMKEVHRIQAALYPHASADEIVVSNRETDEVLTPDFIEQTHRQAELTRQLLAGNPTLASTTYTPHHDICYTCANLSCPFPPSTRQLAVANPTPR